MEGGERAQNVAGFEMVILKTIRRFVKGCRRAGIFAITSRCNCRCETCDIYKSTPFDIPLSSAKRVLDFMERHDFLIAYLTGGEPSLHPNIVEIIKYASQLGLIVSLTTNGTIPASTLQKIKHAGLDVLSVSIDSWNPDVSESIRRHKGILDKQITTIQLAKKLKINVYGCTLLGKHMNPESIEKMVKYVDTVLDIPFGFCYPATTKVNTYRLGESTSFHSKQMISEIARRLLTLKTKGYRIANLATYIKEIIRVHDHQDAVFPCRGGEYVFYIDWFGNVYPCFLKQKLFNILEDPTPIFLNNVCCNDCLIDCFREPSLLAYLFSQKLVLNEIKYNFPFRDIFF